MAGTTRRRRRDPAFSNARTERGFDEPGSATTATANGFQRHAIAEGTDPEGTEPASRRRGLAGDEVHAVGRVLDVDRAWGRFAVADAARPCRGRRRREAPADARRRGGPSGHECPVPGIDLRPARSPAGTVVRDDVRLADPAVERGEVGTGEPPEIDLGFPEGARGPEARRDDTSPAAPVSA